jgi:hypothetical protein
MPKVSSRECTTELLAPVLTVRNQSPGWLEIQNLAVLRKEDIADVRKELFQPQSQITPIGGIFLGEMDEAEGMDRCTGKDIRQLRGTEMGEFADKDRRRLGNEGLDVASAT